MELRIDAEFENKIPPLTEEEFVQLENNIVSEGIVFSPIITWEGVIVDGHNRYRIIQKHLEIKFTTHEKEFADRYEAIAWICKNQLGRRNLTPHQKKYLIGKQYEAEKMRQGTNNQYIQAKSDNSQIGNFHSGIKTCERIAKDNGVSKNTVLRAEAFSKAVDIADEVEPGIRSELLAGKIKPTEKDIQALARAAPEERPALIEELRKSPDGRKKQKKPNHPKDTTLAQIRQIAEDMLHPKSRGTREDMIYELEDALDSLMFRWTMCLTNNADYFAEPDCRKKVDRLTQTGLDYLKQILEGEIPT